MWGLGNDDRKRQLPEGNAVNITKPQERFLRNLSEIHPHAFQYATGGDLPTSKAAASRALDQVSEFLGGYRPNTQRAAIAEQLRLTPNEKDCYTVLSPKVGKKPLLFQANSGGGRVPLPLTAQRTALIQTIEDVKAALRPLSTPSGGNSTQGVKDAPTEAEAPAETDAEAEARRAAEDAAEAAARAEWEAKVKFDTDHAEGNRMDADFDRPEAEAINADLDHDTALILDEEWNRANGPYGFLVWIQDEVRPFVLSQNADGAAFDQVGLRPAMNGSRLIAAGIPEKAVRHAMTMHYPAEARRHLQVEDYDVTEFRPDLRRDGMHKALPYCLHVVAAGVPLALVGPAGTGKTTLAGQIAKVLGLPFGAVSMTGGTTPSAFNGRVNPFNDNKTPSAFLRIFTEGGVFLFDELDAGDENLTLKVNMALANGEFFNDATGERHPVHENFVPVAGLNTLGLGADRNYTGRVKLDAAALDRWNMGRVRIELDTDLEAHVYDEGLTAPLKFDLASL